MQHKSTSTNYSKGKKITSIEVCINVIVLLNCLAKAYNLAVFKMKFAVQYLKKILKGILHLQIF